MKAEIRRRVLREDRDSDGAGRIVSAGVLFPALSVIRCFPERRGFSSTKGAYLVGKRNSTEELAQRDFLHRFFHDLATPLSAVSLHLEGADRRVKRGADPTESLAVARAELSRAFDLFEQGRECLLHSGRA